MRAMAARPVAMIRADQLWLAVEPVDMRLGIDGLSLKVQQALGRSPCDGSAYAFCKRAPTVTVRRLPSCSRGVNQAAVARGDWVVLI